MKTIKAKCRGSWGVHPDDEKHLARDASISVLPMPSLLRVSMSQHLGAPAKPVVKKGDTVRRGQVIGEATGFISAHVHAPTSGAVKAVTPAATPSGLTADSIDIEPDGQDTWSEDIDTKARERQSLVEKLHNAPEAARQEAVACIADAGITGMGGAGFPTHVKLSPPDDKPIDTLIINGAECEPYLTADFRLMVEHAEQLWKGAVLIRNILGARTLRLAIEDNKPEAVRAMEKAGAAVDGDTAIVVLETEYPQGAEKQQIYAVTGREVPSGGLPMDVGTVVENVGTTFAVWEALTRGRPLTERITTVTGSPVEQPGNVQARIGTLFSDLIEFCGGFGTPPAKLICGGPMMGFAQPDTEGATTKTTSGLLAMPPSAVRSFTSMPCIGCGRCVDACPAGLMPSELSQILEAEDFDAAEDYHIMDCIECGCCAFVCPARRPLVQHMKRGKAYAAMKRRQAQEKS